MTPPYRQAWFFRMIGDFYAYADAETSSLDTPLPTKIVAEVSKISTIGFPTKIVAKASASL